MLSVMLVATLVVPAEKPTMAVMPFQVEGLAVNEVGRLNTAMRARAEKHGYELQSDAMTTQLVDASQSLGVDCDTQAVACGTKIGKIADVQFVLLGHALGGVDGKVALDMRLIDVKQGAEVRHASLLVPTEPEQQTQAVAAFSDVLFSDAPLATFTIDADPPGCEIVVDGGVRAVSPFKQPIGDLAPGDHYIVVRKKGYLPYATHLHAFVGEVPSLQASLAVDPEGMHTGPTTMQTAVPFIVAGAGALVAIGGGVATFFGYLPYAQFEHGSQQVASVNATQKGELSNDDITKITQGHTEAEAGATAWNGYGRATVVGGVVGISAGVIAAVGGAIWGAVLLGESDEAKDATAAK